MHTNKLIHETSPYLLQHAHNPVDWYAWGEDALAKAKNENKPILVSIGYAACHWCHVMERESFENEETAAIMNQNFVNIKIDREERPDIDHIYMDAVQAMTGSGGWPLNVFLTPDCKPFYGGTYFPPVRAFNRSSWSEILHSVSRAYHEKTTEVENQAEKLTEHLRNSYTFSNTPGDENDAFFSTEALNTMAVTLLKAADKEWGGFGVAPKFPQTFAIQFLLRHYHFTNDASALSHAQLSLDKMIYGGIYDQLGGGFARYSTDTEWLAPHFEKMLYDNAQLIMVISEAYQLTKKELYRKTIIDTVDFLKREMLYNNAGFFSALDADSEGVEGKFYTWQKDEIVEVLKDDSRIFCDFYNISEHGNWEKTNILRVVKPLEVFASENHMNVQQLEELLVRSRQLLMQERDRRVRPTLDDKILLSWNALTNIALSKAYAATRQDDFRELAIKNMHFLEEKLSGTDGWFHTYKNEAKTPAFLDDYAYLVQAYIHLQEITGEQEYLLKARELCEFVIKNFEEAETGFFFFTSMWQKDVIVRKKEVYDGASPSGNSFMAYNLYYLGVVFNNEEWRERARKMVANLSRFILGYPASFGIWAVNFQNMVFGLNEIAVIGKNIAQVLPDLLQAYIPNRILQSSYVERTYFPLLSGKKEANELKIYLCKDYTCQAPVFSVSALLESIKFRNP